MATVDSTAAPYDLDAGDLYERYRMMFLIRRFEEAAERQYKAARIGGYCHLSSGQEGVPVSGACSRSRSRRRSERRRGLNPWLTQRKIDWTGFAL
jgi:TPP-dependent pyruvate/acetoin dehydrogenase alpha subunit